MLEAIAPEFDPERLCQRIAEQDRKAEAELVARFQPRIKTFLNHRLKQREGVEELTQEVLIAVLCSLREGRLRDPKTLPGFVYGVARNLLNNYFRVGAREKTESLAEQENLAAQPKAQDDENWQAARAEIDKLEGTDREILTLLLVEGRTAAEIGKRLGMSAEAVRQRKSRALRRIAAKWKQLSRTAGLAPLQER